MTTFSAFLPFIKKNIRYRGIVDAVFKTCINNRATSTMRIINPYSKSFGEQGESCTEQI